MRLTVRALRLHAINSSFFSPASLPKAIERLGFVQADPIRSPARAQDLILRHRVKGYRAGDLEKQYPKLDLEEDFLYAYGFMPKSTWQLLHPRMEGRQSKIEQRIFELVSSRKSLHPRDLEAHLGRDREVNAWGGYSKATTRALEALHYRGLLRVVRRENGIRVYEAARASPEPQPPHERLRQLVLLVARILAPVPERSLRATLQLLARAAPALEGRQTAVTDLIADRALSAATVGGLRYVWPAGPIEPSEAKPVVRILAPFDPLVWDRRRFEHFWGWAYRFEAYTPLAKRKLGYYAMPLLWREHVIGWVNASGKSGSVDIQAGFVKKEPKETAFRDAFDAEVHRFRLFLQRRRDRNLAGVQPIGSF
jgi:uncharacterized protein YcaQ